LAISLTLTFDQVTLNTKTLIWSNSVPNFSEIEQSAAEL